MNSLTPTPEESPLKRLTPFLVLTWLLVFWTLFFTSTLPNASSPRRTFNRLDILALLPEIYESLFSADSSLKSSSSWMNLLERVDVFSIAVLIVLAGFAIGRLALRLTGLWADLDRAERAAISGGVGLSLLSLWTLATGWLGLISPTMHWGALACFILLEGVLSSREILARKSKGNGSLDNQSSATLPASSQGRHDPLRWLKRFVIAVSIPFLCCMLLGSMLPPTDFDVKEYHLGGPKEYFLAGRILFLPHDVYTSFPFLTEMLSLTGMILRGDWERGAYAGQTVLAAFAPITAMGVFCVARRLAGDAAGWWGGIVYLTIPWTYRISIIAYTEGALCCYVVLTLLAFQIWQAALAKSPNLTIPRWPQLATLGFLAGSAVATKYPGMVLVAIPFAGAVLWVAGRESRCNLRVMLLSLTIYGAGVLVAFGPWMLKNLIETGNPVYPLLYGVFGGIDWDDAMHRKWQAAHPARLFAGSWEDFAGVIYKNDWQSPLLFGIAPLALLGRNPRKIGYVWGYALLLLAAWYLLTHRIDRFWVPMNSIMAVLSGCGLAALLPLPERTQTPVSKNASRTKSSRVSTTDAAGVAPLQRLTRIAVSGLLIITLVYNFGFITTPLCGNNAYLSSYATAEDETCTQSVKIINEMHLPEGSKVLFVGEAELFNAHFPYAYNTVFDRNLLEAWTSHQKQDADWELKPLAEIRQQFQSEGITHVFINWNEILRYRTTYGFTDFVHPDRIRKLTEIGLLVPVTLPDWISYREWEKVDDSWKREIERWAPVLKQNVRGTECMLQYQLFRVEQHDSDSTM